MPFSLVSQARDLKRAADSRAKTEGDENLRYDEVWCVFDVDEHPKVGEARQMALDNGLRLAMSNPCFELWLLLHLRESPGAQHRHAVQKMFYDMMPGVSWKHLDFERLSAGGDAAYRRAERLEREARVVGEGGRNPTTEVFHLVASIDEQGAARRAAPVLPDAGRAKAEAAAAAALEQAEREAAAMPDLEE